MLEYSLPAKEGSWQEKDGLPRLMIYAYVRVQWPCPYDGDMVRSPLHLQSSA